MTLRSSAPSEINPAGTNIRDSSLAPGKREPHVLQNQVCQSALGFFQVAICPSPRIHLNASLSMTTTAIPLLPVDLRQIEQ
jgi:hypothetical protein